MASSPDRQDAEAEAAAATADDGRQKDACDTSSPIVLVFDCETNGIGGFSPCRQDLCQLAFIVCDRRKPPDECVLEEYSEYVCDAATRVCANHVSGFTLHDVQTKGVPAAQALHALRYALAKWQPQAVFAHNAPFDREAVARAGFDWDEALPTGCAVRCTMREATRWCALPSRRRGGGFKWPKLAELAARLGIDTAGYRLHDALDDCRVLMHIVRQESVWSEPPPRASLFVVGGEGVAGEAEGSGGTTTTTSVNGQQ